MVSIQALQGARGLKLTCDIAVVELVSVRIQVLLHTGDKGIGDILLPKKLFERSDTAHLSDTSTCPTED